MSVARDGEKLAPRCSFFIDAERSSVNRRRESESSELSRENRENGRSLATNQPTVGLRLRSLRRSRRLRVHSQPLFLQGRPRV